MADALHGVGQLTVSCNEPVEIVLADIQQVGVLDGADRGGARTPAEQGHFTKRVPRAEHRNCAAGGLVTRQAVGQDFHSSMRYDVEGVTWVTGPKQNFTCLQLPVADTRENSLDLLGRQMAHQVARREQLDALVRIRLFARQGIFAKLGDVAYGRSLFLQKQRCRVVDDGANSKSGADKCPRSAIVEALMMKCLCALIGKLDRQRGDQSAGGKGQQAGEWPF